MTVLNDIGRVVLRHGWQEPLEWARAVYELADLSDGEIERLLEKPTEERVVGAAGA